MHVDAAPDAPPLEPSWAHALAPQLEAPELRELYAFLHAEERAGHEVYPPRALVFDAFARTPFDATRVVIVGQDPYHGPGQAMGLAFSVPDGVAPPPSLRNLLTELEADLGIPRPAHGNLQAWADRGVLLLNTALTVRAGEAGSHAGCGWERITDAALRALSEQRDGLVFLLWGRHAQARGALLDEQRHLVLMAPHPSPLSARRGFFGSRPFSRTNAWLESRGAAPMDWTLGTAGA